MKVSQIITTREIFLKHLEYHKTITAMAKRFGCAPSTIKYIGKNLFGGELPTLAQAVSLTKAEEGHKCSPVAVYRMDKELYKATGEVKQISEAKHVESPTWTEVWKKHCGFNHGAENW